MARTHVEHIHAPEIEEHPLTWEGWPAGAVVKTLSVDHDSAATTALVTLPAGYERPAGRMLGDSELIVLSGSLAVGPHQLGRLSYRHVPSGAADQRWESDEGATLLFMTRTAGPAFTPAAGEQAPGDADGTITLDGDQLPFGRSPIANGPPNSQIAMLRQDPDSGEMVALARNGPREHPVYEFHDCIEECYLLEGDIHILPGGQMLEGTYFWRPPYYTHGQARSDTGSLLYVYTDSELINRFTDGIDRTPEENRAQVERERAAAG